ncbi:CatB-related O-acetyltransferase [Janibacter sp. YB324]|uniref:CatB-related O-acetyltransferase n=1 Tax=Janibacter sp. YB324 TaxID=2761047 RepID=UPI00162ABB52|nr:CatB-related O-acetyltransferase [Janibacter sp. YB324]QNF93481.1 CatB-related O-acetyltransferase [Janibacter sp. YB324]
MRRQVKHAVKRVRQRLKPPTRTDLLPRPQRLDQRPDLQEYQIGRYSWGHLTVSYRTAGCGLSVGQFCSFAYGTRIILGGEHHAEFVSTYRFPSYPPFKEASAEKVDWATVGGGDVTIGNDVWIGHEALILSGVTLGDGVIVGAGSVVRASAPPYALVVGNPARVAGFRFPAEQIEALQRIKWWDWSEERLIAALPQLMSDDIQAFIDAHDVGG